ncbi:Sucraseferredoxin-like protein [Hygrophoropsis aurantiaca]|uniref:Sucraseferredoxin-like protein n=1 Tax=Hygrophoropsis aurantiaca TaxID=72124 RepID=A0ACB8ATN4_9AGAM|nr:Sucraseferredoxin-like protein [Hygrophoropsis aurantiaca]
MTIDIDSDLLGTVKPYRRQIIISTGQSDWPKKVTHTAGTLAAYIDEANDSLGALRKHNAANGESNGNTPSVPGLLSYTDTSRLSILNGSHRTFCDDPNEETVLVLPDFKVVAGVPRTLDGARELWAAALDPALGRAGAATSLRSWVLPYSCLILLCSHKRKDKRCHITAPILEKAFTQYLEHENWEVHTELEDLSHHEALSSPTQNSGSDSSDTESEAESAFEAQLKALPDHHKALILRNSHIGGHKFAGNCIIYTPRGACVWYGRITPHDVEAIVKCTIIAGQVLPPLLRGGMELSRPGCKTLYEW